MKRRPALSRVSACERRSASDNRLGYGQQCLVRTAPRAVLAYVECNAPQLCRRQGNALVTITSGAGGCQ